MSERMAQQLRISLSKPAFYLTDPRLVVNLDQDVVYDGSFTSGVDAARSLTPGSRRVQTSVKLGPFERRRSYDIKVAEGADLTLTLEYSRLWGNFSAAPNLSPSR
jgi:hypothetical protein